MAELVFPDLFLHTIFFKACTKSEKIKRQEEHYFRKILENETDETVHKAFKEIFTEQKIIGKRAATDVNTNTSAERILLCVNDEEKEKPEEVRYGEQQRGSIYYYRSIY